MDLLQPIKLIPRWPGHGDLHVLVDGPYVYLDAADVERLAGIPAWEDGDTILADEWPHTIDGTPHYRLDAALAKVQRHADVDTAAAFVTWLDETMPDLIDPRTVKAARRDAPLPEAITVAHAARELTAAGLRLGRTGLFRYLAELGWLERAGDHWSLTDLSRAAGWATVRRIKHPAPGKGRHAAYDQTYITPAGMTELRRQLASARPSEVDGPRAPHAPLFD
ncbi:phage antirepressor KilAC domain-containing protein [Microbacterium excoecariae]|uniref:phage antirepressor KilAC domain-containing protein n=1 Tax=Microbacterium excoecariae TaxID=2715210 RepID=UPI0014099C35|nr:phage antirepressor KilAC domain-containing protein [Microbacterium excoecariae]NHI16833.1 hypothetical protein [Microbacterium excoecariae]